MKYLSALLAVFLTLCTFAPSTKAQGGCSRGYPYYANHYCYALFCQGRTAVTHCSQNNPHNSCIRCVEGAVELPCCPESPAYSAWLGGDCNISGASLHNPADLYARGFSQSCDGTLRPTVVHCPIRVPRPTVNVRSSGEGNNVENERCRWLRAARCFSRVGSAESIPNSTDPVTGW